jgi:CBS domain-containing protein
MKIADVMTQNVVTVGPKTALREVATILAERRISGVPVVDGGRVVGVVSEGDILAKESAPAEPGRRLGHKHRPTATQTKARAHTAGTAMTSPAVTVSPERTLTEAARLMIEKGVNRLPVVDQGRLVGIVTRADLVRAFIRDDAEIERELHEVALKTLWIDPKRVRISVDRGEVLLEGEVDSDADAELLDRFARRVPGVVGVLSRLHWQIDHPKVPQSNPRVPKAPRR